MQPIIDLVILFAYRLIVVPLGFCLAVVGALFSAKIRAGFYMRIYPPKTPAWAGQFPTLWIHCSSGEFEYAKPVLKQWKSVHANWKILVTYFSPSYRQAIESNPLVDFSTPLPLDLPGPLFSLIRRFKPSLVAIARTDVWPEMVEQCRRARIPAVLFSTTRSRLRPRDRLALPFWRWLYSRLTLIFCVTEADATQLRSLGVSAPIETLGDTRFDQVIARLESPKALKDSLCPRNQPVLVAGSTWAEDEEVLLDACEDLLRQRKMRLIIAPHEPSKDHLDALEGQIRRRGLDVQRYTVDQELHPEGILLIDTIGILAELYQWGSMAVVGGSFRSSVHSVMEPLAAGLITMVGPHHLNNREALTFKEIPVSPGRLHMVNATPNAADLKDQILEFLNASGESRAQWKTQIKSLVMQNAGATRRLVERLGRYHSS